MMGIVFVALVLTSIFYYFPRIKRYHYNPINLYIALPGLGFLLFTLSVCISSALPEQSKAVPILVAVIINIVLMVIHVSAHANKFDSVILSIVNYIIHTILSILMILLSGFIIGIYLLGLHFFTDMLSDFFDDIFGDHN